LLFFLLESFIPFYNYTINRLRHAGVNILSAVIAFIINYTLFYFLIFSALEIDKGIVDLIPNDLLKLTAGLLLFDMWMYIWHRMNHEIPFLWRFHKAHHSDTSMDSTTGIRFHPIEVVLSTGARLPIYILLGINPFIIATYESAMAIIVIFHHSNINLNKGVDYVLSLIIPTPQMHRIHHSSFYKETNSNYGTLLSVWDRVFGTYNNRQDTENIEIGLEKYREKSDQTFKGFISTPFR
jgi:sterol desaturase/sphingolipid hydroxylase (fatty acid hydroxylase superfamily)